MASQVSGKRNETVSISPLLKRLAYPLASEIQVEASEIASAFALIFEDRLNVVQTTALLTLLHSTRKDKDPKVIAECSQRMREAASQVEKTALRKAIRGKEIKLGGYRGGLVRSLEALLYSYLHLSV
jgi:anthranilate phosphoribosyltransferase